ncbi:hypothetical protein MARA_02430 (plasmid) [Mycolicibacterium arabiense]|uniref:HTH marR-type domain-containing protein n=1 Tax=Mycolicibacterium arabiense TaxID=1286181 RepID=A0A7I7RQL1_9MYCO|nr:MarR family transcriptional regulator [Mycolicibacterium arabiense]MCV7372166.1 MarR family transcriptional regulator [Mycolicibacterium arabiense]BBY46813.1 hypothetical protein MARA_02430 [Mycolicibacterium arabiense]
MSSAPTDGPATASTAVRVLQAARRLAVGLETELQREQLGVDHWLAIEALAESGGLTMAELQAETVTAGPTLTRVVDKLSTRSLAYREVDALDRRKVRVYLSDRGVQTRDRLAAALADVEAEWASTEGFSDEFAMNSRAKS